MYISTAYVAVVSGVSFLTPFFFKYFGYIGKIFVNGTWQKKVIYIHKHEFL